MKSYKDLDISSLILKVRGGDDAAFGELICRYDPMLHKVSSGFCSGTLSNNEAYSEACIALHKAALSFDLTRTDVTFGLYARICATRRLYDLLGKESRATAPAVDIDMDTLSYNPACEDRLVRSEQMRRSLEIAHSLLSDYEYQVFLLYLQGYSTAESCDLLSKSAKSIDNAKARCFKRLREQQGIFSDIL
jgi:RNA polymerase sporulation-specific sigma factor